MNYYISDMHFGHGNIIRLCNRPFATVNDMDSTILDNWNKAVGVNDTVYIIGDVAFKAYKNPVELLRKLNGHKILIEGNHDVQNLKNPEFRKCFDGIQKMMTIFDDGKKIVLCHYPLLEWDGYFRGTLHIYGHIHNNVKNRAYQVLQDEPNAFNVGVEILEYTPRTLSEVIDMNNKFNQRNMHI